MNFIDNVEDWIDKFTSEKLISYINQYLNKYKFMEAQIVKVMRDSMLKFQTLKNV